MAATGPVSAHPDRQPKGNVDANGCGKVAAGELTQPLSGVHEMRVGVGVSREQSLPWCSGPVGDSWSPFAEERPPRTGPPALTPTPHPHPHPHSVSPGRSSPWAGGRLSCARCGPGSGRDAGAGGEGGWPGPKGPCTLRTEGPWPRHSICVFARTWVCVLPQPEGDGPSADGPWAPEAAFRPSKDGSSQDGRERPGSAGGPPPPAHSAAQRADGTRGALQSWVWERRALGMEL